MNHSAIRELLQSLGRDPSLQMAVRAIAQEPPRTVSLSGLNLTAKALYLVILSQQIERQILLVVDGNKQAEAISELVETFFELLVASENAPRPQTIPALDVLPSQHLSPHSAIGEQRAIGLWRLASERVPLTITPVSAALLRTQPADFYRRLALTLRAGDEIPLEDLVAHLESIGYEKREPVEMVGEYSVRGGILDIFPAESEKPVRIELFGDTIEEMRRFEVATQRSALKITECQILPLLECPRPRGSADVAMEPGWEFRSAAARPGTASIFDMLDNPLIVIDEPEAVASAAKRLWVRLEEPGMQEPVKDFEIPPDDIFFQWDELAAKMAPGLSLRELELGEDGIHIATRPSMAFHGKLQVALAEASSLIDEGYRVVFFSPSAGEVERLADVCQEYGVPFQLGMETSRATPQYLAERAYLGSSMASAFLVKGGVRHGVTLPESRIAIFGSEDLFDASELVARPAAKRSQLAAFTSDMADLKPGDFVVHSEHGIARFIGLREIGQGEHKDDFMLLEYAGDAKLYVPLSRLDLVQKFRGAGEGAPPLDRLGGATWKRTKSRVKAKMRDMADELIKLYAARKMAEGFTFSSDSNWQREFEDSFDFTPTTDQISAVQDIKRDMESPQPMDRLLCGDVGFGKTEVAMRAAFKALGDGKQVAILAPTTVLSFQHYETFRRRFAPFPVVIDLLSRFRSPKESKAVIEEVAHGKVDILVGTHRLLSKDVEFRDLGLLIVDEEQRFGVRHKEQLKKLKHNVDVLTMSATPIPRTLHMSLLGLRDMSVIETPPKDRLSIHTVVAHYHNDLIKSAIEQELGRGGQVYFVHNRVDSIWMRAAAIQEMIPNCRVGVGHGQMGEDALEKVLLGFMRHEYDVFVCTTIVENGLDIPLANTMIIENAERYGLSELYQLRGRVGRSNRRAYAYLLVPPDTELSEVARKRLAALKEFSDLGAGFKIAALDLELRGAGNLLGGEQHGHIAVVGFETYVRLLEETVQELKGEEVPLQIHSTLNLGLDLRIPLDYIADEHQRLRYYKRIADAHDREHADKILDEVRDRYGDPPEKLRNLIEFSLLKTKAERLGVESIERRHGLLNVKFHSSARVDPAALMRLVGNTAGAQFTPAGVLRLPFDPAQTPAELLAFLGASFAAL